MTAKKILLTWELGEGLGHVRPLAFLGEHLADAGHELVFACRDPLLGAREIRPDLGRILAAPHQPRPRRFLGPGRNYASLLQIQGYSEERELMALVRSWRDLIDLVQPDLIIADHSPSAILAARNVCPVVQVGTGFTIPPCHTHRFPDLDWTDEASLTPAVDARILQLVNRVLSHFGTGDLNRLPEFLETSGRCVFSFAELDPYRNVRKDMLFSPLEPVSTLRLHPSDLKVFSYVSADYAQIKPLLKLFESMTFDVTSFVRGFDARDIALSEAKGLSILPEAPPLSETLTNSSLIIHHGGMATSQAALLAGRPQIILPQHTEARSTAKTLEELGVARRVEADKIQALPALIREYLADHSWREAALETARQFRRKETRDALTGFRSAVDTALFGAARTVQAGT